MTTEEPTAPAEEAELPAELDGGPGEVVELPEPPPAEEPEAEEPTQLQVVEPSPLLERGIGLALQLLEGFAAEWRGEHWEAEPEDRERVAQATAAAAQVRAAQLGVAIPDGPLGPAELQAVWAAAEVYGPALMVDVAAGGLAALSPTWTPGDDDDRPDAPPPAAAGERVPPPPEYDASPAPAAAAPEDGMPPPHLSGAGATDAGDGGTAGAEGPWTTT